MENREDGGGRDGVETNFFFFFFFVVVVVEAGRENARVFGIGENDVKAGGKGFLMYLPLSARRRNVGDFEVKWTRNFLVIRVLSLKCCGIGG